MKKAISATFLLFYAAFTVVAITEHTASYVSTIARHSPPQTRIGRAASPYVSQVRILQEPFVGFEARTAFALGDNGPTSVRPSSIRFEVDSRKFTPSRAPPAVL